MGGVSVLLGLLALLLSACAPTATATPKPSPTTALTATPTPTVTPGAAPTATPQPTPTPTPTAAPRPTPTLAPTPALTHPTVTVVSVVDGDTIDVNIEGQEERIRLIGVGAPEVYGGEECFGRAASDFTKSVVQPGTPVTLEKDVSERDRYGRLLRYGYLLDGRMFNEVLVAEGYAQVATFPPDVKHTDRFLEAQRRAREAGSGLWSKCIGGLTLTPSSVPTSKPTPVMTSEPSGNCDPAYPDVCIKPPPPDLDCEDIEHQGFKVLPPDPHRFDSNGDGIGCES
jgi:micrococcal nuclease